jgi:hypothetical protein
VDSAEAVAAGPLVIVPLVGFGLVAFDHSRRQVWELDLGPFSAPGVAERDGQLFVLSDECLRLDPATGQVRQRVVLRNPEGPRLGEVHSPRVHGACVFGVDAMGLIFCVDLDRDTITWSFATREPTPRTTGLALDHGQLWALDLGGNVYGFRLP